MPGDEVLYVDESHQYFVNGQEYRSVSTVLSILSDFSRVPRQTLEFKRMVGRAAHRAIELYESWELDMDTVDDAVMPYLESWLKFRTTKPLRVVAAERIVYSKKHRYAGRLDMVAGFEDGPWVLDLKCTYAMPPETSLQTAAYMEAWNENEETRVKKRAGLQLKPDGSIAEFYPYDRIGNKNDFPVFLNALNLDRWITKNRRAT